MSPPDTVPQVTHIEIRRVQNGFVVMAVDYREPVSNWVVREEPQRAAFIAVDQEGLNNVIGTILAGAEVNWLPTADLPMTVMRKNVADMKNSREAEIKRQQQQLAGAAPPSAQRPQGAYPHHTQGMSGAPTPADQFKPFYGESIPEVASETTAPPQAFWQYDSPYLRAP